jgi:glycosyltransferase involved in cell wall biosynthesis
MISVIIPSYNHAAYVADAVRSALAQTVPVEVIVIDDGSTDNTQAVLATIPDDRVTCIRTEHRGVAHARNIGIDAAHGEFLMFLDADDTIEPMKGELQLALMDANAGWVLCDTRIEDVSGRVQLASERYDYAHKRLNGWLEPWLAVANFIPVHAPLVRKSALSGFAGGIGGAWQIRFPEDKAPEDWHFWWALAREARCRYTPAILATYKKRRGGRNATKAKDYCRPGQPSPLLLNLGCGNPDAASWHTMPGCVNLDKSLGWRFEDGLRDFADASVDGITISHSLMYVERALWPMVMRECARVLKPGGILRITEDNTEHEESRTFRVGWRGSDPAVTMTGPAMARRYMEAAGFTVYDCTAETGSDPLRQTQHGDAPHCFWIEGIREQCVLFEPHADDAALFAAFSCIRHSPRVVTCFPSSGDYGDTGVRHAETVAAMDILGAGPCEQWDGKDLEIRMRALDARLRPTVVFAPDMDSSHIEHREVAAAAAIVFGARVRWYCTYNAMGKVRGEPVPFETGWAGLKRKALSCYLTQLAHPRAKAFFDWDLGEYTP